METGTRNRLVHVNRANTRGNVLNVVNERSDDVYRILSSQKAMRFLALGRDRDEEVEGIRLADPDERGPTEDRFLDAQLETRLGPDALAKKLLKIAREARTAEEEQGVNILYLALGFMTWFEDGGSEVPREAPLVLLPVELVRNQRTSTYDLKVREDDLLTNLPLQQRLKEDFGIELPELEVEDGWLPSHYFDEVEQVIASRDHWRIDRNGIQLGFFSFSKLLMFLDLAIDAWPQGALATHPLTRGLLFEGFDHEPPLFDPGERLDAVLPPDRIFHVVDADASQARVIEEVRSGRNLVVQGPPGTGKSQTITNIIAAAAREGRRVLFVAEKMAALSVVHDRLVNVGLSDICLELHSRTANKKQVLAELARTIASAREAPSEPPPPVQLRSKRDKLNNIADLMHWPIEASGETPFSVLSRQVRYIGLGAPPPTIDGDALAKLTRADEDALAELLAEYGALARRDGSASPFEGVQNLALQPVELSRLAPELQEAAVASEALARAVRQAHEALSVELPNSADGAQRAIDLLRRLENLPAGSAAVAGAMLSCPDAARLASDLEAGCSWRDARDSAAEVFTEEALRTPPTVTRGALVAGKTSFFARWGGAYRQASRALAGALNEELPKPAAERLRLLDQLSELQRLRRAWEDDREFCSRVLGDAWRGERTGFARLVAIAAWCDRVRSAKLRAPDASLLDLASDTDRLAGLLAELSHANTSFLAAVGRAVDRLDLDPVTFADGSHLQADAEKLGARFAAMAAAIERYPDWARLARLRARLTEAGIDELATRIAGELTADAAATELRFARAEALWRKALELQPRLEEFSALDRHAIVREFSALERRRLEENVDLILASHLSQVPQGAQGEMAVIRGEIGKKRGHMAIRRLFTRAGTAVQRIKPVLLMSPISVAQFLPPGSLSFDLLVIDEASQVRPEDALGAIARARQIVVVGDQKQLPPSSFFDRLVSEEDDPDEVEEDDGDLLAGAAKAADMESILTLCEARGLGARMLKWHYRSRDPSLIEVSNREFYENGLVLPPSPLQQDPAYGLCFTRVNGIYDRGGKRDNRIEGEAIVRRVAEHARANPSLSLGVVTFSFAQRNLVTELLELARRTDAVLDEFLREGQAEDVFVKNIENVQGDERDVILVSVGYGPSIAGGRLASMSFGPVNAEGGERRLNVLFTRARVRCEVFASFDPGDIDPVRSRAEGPRILKRYLECAKSGRIDDAAPTGEAADSPFEEDVADVIRSLGFLADPQVGSAGFRIDLGIRHPDQPGTYLLAVECDGAAYHSALWARERDRLRQDVLEHLGWSFHRIWSTDWFYRRSAEIARLREVLAEARDRGGRGVRIQGANSFRPASEVEIPTPETAEVPEPVLRQMPTYTRAVFPTGSRQEPHEVPVWTLSGLVARIVHAEGPIHQEEVARRVAASYGKDKAGSRIISATLSALRTAQRRDEDLERDGEFWFTRSQKADPPVRDRSAESGATLKAGCLSMLEIEAALRLARNDNAGGEPADLVRSAARLMGFRRVGSDLQARLSTGLLSLD